MVWRVLHISVWIIVVVSWSCFQFGVGTGKMWTLELTLGFCLCSTLVVYGQDGECGSPDGNCSKVNIALGKPANQSSTYSEETPASMAVDGNISTCMHTQGSEREDVDTWQVDLGNNYTVTDITIYNDAGGHPLNPHSQRIAAIWVYVDDHLCYKFPDSLTIGGEPVRRYDITCQRPIRGRLVRFVKNGFVHAKHYSFINFCEVEIWVCQPGLYGAQCDRECDSRCHQGLCDSYDGTCNLEMVSTTESPPCPSPDGNCDKVNVAVGKKASMSSQYMQRGYSSGPASLAVDGNTSASYLSCVHTRGDLDSELDWWQVDLGRNYTVTDITIYHRERGSHWAFSQRIAGVWVYVDDTLCYKFPDSHDVDREEKEKDDITCQQPIRGQIVRFSKDGRTHNIQYSFINFCEVQIWVCRSGLYGAHCENECDSNCQQGLCDNYDGTCDLGCSEGYYGADCSEQCGQCQGQEACDRQTGRCPHGCQPLYQPPECQLPILKTTTEDPSCDSPDGNCNKVNVAEGKEASISTPYVGRGLLSRPASLAVDGNTSTQSWSCVHTRGDLDRKVDWWQVDLGRNYTVTDITVYHREGGYQGHPYSLRIAGVWVYVDSTLCYKFPDSRSIGSSHREKDDITCDRPITGQIVRFAKEGVTRGTHFSFINFCEVQIWVCRRGLYGAQCDRQCDSHCQEGLCDNLDGTCNIGCSEGYYGADCSEQCGQCQGQETCDRRTGRCPHGCQPLYQPPECQLPVTTTTTTTTPETTTTTTPTTATTTTTTTTTTTPETTTTTTTTTATPITPTTQSSSSITPTLSSDTTPPTITLTLPVSKPVAAPKEGDKAGDALDSSSSSNNNNNSSSSNSNNNNNNSSSSSSSSTSSSSSSSSSNFPVMSGTSRQSSTSGNRRNKKYTEGDMAGVAVSMVILGAVLGAAGLALYCRFFGRRRHPDGMVFRLVDSDPTET